MRVEQLPPRQRRLLALAILAGLIIAAYVVFILPLFVMAESYDERIARLSDRLASSRQILGEGVTARERLRQVVLAEKRGGYYLDSDRPTLAAAELQRRVKQTVEQHGGSIVSSQVLGEQEEGGLHRVVLRVNMRMDLPSFERILYSLETQPPVLVLDNITMVARPSGSTARWRGSSEQQELDASLDVMGYRRVLKDSEA
jgi:general secretion pathway protein M